MTAILLLILIPLYIYSLMITSFIIGWLSIKPFEADNNINTCKSDFNDLFISIVIAARNEEKKISQLLECIKLQNFSKELYEIIIVDDSSEDRTREIAGSYKNGISNLFIISNPPDNPGKKQAIKQGVHQSKGNLIITIDADCQVGEKWLKTIASYYQNFKPKMIVGPVEMKGKSIFTNFQSLEFQSLIASGAGAIGIHKPVMCNGANLVFEKSLYSEIQHSLKFNYSSGDDIFLLIETKKKYNKGIYFLKSYDAVVYTDSATSLKEFYYQRTRWVSKSKAYCDKDIIASAIIVFLANLSLLSTFFMIFIDSDYLYAFSFAFVTKSIPDFILLFLFSGYFKTKRLLHYFLPLQLIYPFYVIAIGTAGFFTKFYWKGRKLEY